MLTGYVCVWITVVTSFTINSIINIPLMGAEICLDRSRSCRRIGRRLPASLCYDEREHDRCCETCEKLRMPFTSGCQYGDHAEFCADIGRTKPIADCYAQRETCCETCRIYDFGVPDCPYGDKNTWCTSIGDTFDPSSCYDHESYCCQTCKRFSTVVDGCHYGDKAPWCKNIATLTANPMESCRENIVINETCCKTCHDLQEGFLIITQKPSTPATSLSSPAAGLWTKATTQQVVNISITFPITNQHFQSPSILPSHTDPQTQSSLFTKDSRISRSTRRMSTTIGSVQQSSPSSAPSAQTESSSNDASRDYKPHQDSHIKGSHISQEETKETLNLPPSAGASPLFIQTTSSAVLSCLVLAVALLKD